MATTNIGKLFGVVTSKNQATAITESKQDANSGQFYITRTNNSNTGGVGNTQGDASEAISLTINGNVLRGISKADAIKLANLSTNTDDGISNLIVGSGLTKTENIIGLDLGTSLEFYDNRTVGVKYDNTLTESSNGLSVNLPDTIVVPDLEALPLSTAAILVKDGSNGVCVNVPALTRLVKLIMAVK